MKSIQRGESEEVVVSSRTDKVGSVVEESWWAVLTKSMQGTRNNTDCKEGLGRADYTYQGFSLLIDAHFPLLEFLTSPFTVSVQSRPSPISSTIICAFLIGI